MSEFNKAIKREAFSARFDDAFWVLLERIGTPFRSDEDGNQPSSKKAMSLSTSLLAVVKKELSNQQFEDLIIDIRALYEIVQGAALRRFDAKIDIFMPGTAWHGDDAMFLDTPGHIVAMGKGFVESFLFEGALFPLDSPIESFIYILQDHQAILDKSPTR